MPRINDFSRDYMMSWTDPAKLDKLNSRRIATLNKGTPAKAFCPDEKTLRVLLRSQRTSDRWVKRLNLDGMNIKDLTGLAKMCPQLRRLSSKKENIPS